MRRLVLALAACALAAPPASPAHAEEHSVSSYCRFVLRTVPTREDVIVYVVAEATATGPTPAAETTVSCTVTNAYNEGFTASFTMVGPASYGTSGQFMRWAGTSVCSESSAVWLNTDLSTHTEVEDKKCRPGD